VLAGYTQLRLARQLAADTRLPWARPRPQPRLSPYRVRRGVPRLLVRLGSPAAAPNRRALPRPVKGRVSGPAPRYPAIKKPTKKPRMKLTTAAEAGLTRPTQHHTDAEQVSGLSSMPTGLNHKPRRSPSSPTARDGDGPRIIPFALHEGIAVAAALTVQRGR
jgi:hypothetical protein